MGNNSGERARCDGDGDGAETGRAMKKGPWTAAEDGILIEYVKKHGEGNWNAVQKHTGLARCGKSCRLRWANHLRPNLKKGSFSQEEERIIIELHAKLGNKWARMAAQLPGRTDNEIKNYWNTRMKRRQRAGLPLYPHELQQEATAFHLRLNSTGASAFSGVLSPPVKPDHNASLFTFSSAMNRGKNFCDSSSLYSTPRFRFDGENGRNNGAFVLPLSSVSPFSQTFQNQPLSYRYFCNSGMDLGAPYRQLVPGLESELPSIQTPPYSTTPASSGTTGGEGMMGGSSARGNSGLLDALLVEAEALSRNEKNCKDESSSGGEIDRGKRMVDQGSDEFSSSHSSTAKRPRIDPLGEMESMDDDLMSLLNNFPSATPIPEWYASVNKKDNTLCESSGNVAANEQQKNTASSPTTTFPALEWSLGSSCWNNMPGIC